MGKRTHICSTFRVYRNVPCRCGRNDPKQREIRWRTCVPFWIQKKVNSSTQTYALSNQLRKHRLHKCFCPCIEQMLQAKLFENEWHHSGVRYYGGSVHFHYVIDKPHLHEARGGTKMVQSTMTEMIANVSQPRLSRQTGCRCIHMLPP